MFMPGGSEGCTLARTQPFRSTQRKRGCFGIEVGVILSVMPRLDTLFTAPDFWLTFLVGPASNHSAVSPAASNVPKVFPILAAPIMTLWKNMRSFTAIKLTGRREALFYFVISSW